MLVGRTCYDYHNYSGANIDPLCPSYLVSTTFWSQTESDAAFGDLGSGYAEVRVGRLPANTPAEASTAVQHILNYSGLPSTGWRAFIAADTPDPVAGDFAAEADDVINSNPSITWTHNYLGVTDPTAATVTAAMRQAASGGADLLMYNGHGSALYLGNNAPHILEVSDVQQWTGNSVFLAATCTFNWVAKVEEDYHSLAIQGLVQPQGGIAASIGTTTYMNSQPDIDLLKQLLSQGQSAAPNARWGDVLMRTQQWAYQKGQDNSQGSASWYLDLSKTECILGDPAMPLFGKSVPNPVNGANGGTGTGGTGGTTGTGSVKQGTF